MKQCTQIQIKMLLQKDKGFLIEPVTQQVDLFWQGNEWYGFGGSASSNQLSSAWYDSQLKCLPGLTLLSKEDIFVSGHGSDLGCSELFFFLEMQM